MKNVGKLISLCIIIGLVLLITVFYLFSNQGAENQVQEAKPDNTRIATDDILGENRSLTNEDNAGLIVGQSVIGARLEPDQPYVETAPGEGGISQQVDLSPTDKLYQEMELVRLRQTLELEIAEDRNTRALRKQAMAAKITPSRHNFKDVAVFVENQPVLQTASSDTSALGGLTPSYVLSNGSDTSNKGAANRPVARSISDEFENAVGYSKYSRSPARSPYEIKKGTIIPGTLVTEINSDIPGNVVGMVRLDVYDTVTGDHLLIPNGSRVFGIYNPDVSYSQKRLNVVWTHLIFPDGGTLVLEDQQATDIAGRAGFKDKRKGNFLRNLGGNLLYSILDAGETAVQGPVPPKVHFRINFIIKIPAASGRGIHCAKT